MNLDGLLITHIATALHKELAQARILKNITLVDDILYLPVAQKEIKYLTFSLKTAEAEVCLLKNSFNLPKEAKNSQFSIALRKFLPDCYIESIESFPFERILYIHLRKNSTTTSKAVRYHLVFESMGRQTNLLLLDNQLKIMEAFRWVNQSESKSRLIMPNANYHLPNLGNKDTFFLTLSTNEPSSTEKIAMILKELSLSKKTPKNFFCSRFKGISPLFLSYLPPLTPYLNSSLHYPKENMPDEIKPDCLGDTEKTKQELCQSFFNLLPLFKEEQKNLYINKTNAGYIYTLAPLKSENAFGKLDKSDYLLSVDIEQKNQDPLILPIIEALEFCFLKNQELKWQTAYQHHLQLFLSKCQKSITKKIDIFSTELKKAKIHPWQTKTGKVLLCSLANLQKGQESIRLNNPFYAPNKQDEEENLVIKLDPLMTPQQNIENYFKMAKKNARKEIIYQKFLAKAIQLKDYLNNLEFYVEHTLKPSELLELENEIIEFSKNELSKAKQENTAGFNFKITYQSFQTNSLQGQSKKTNRAKDLEKSSPRTFFSHSGLKILIGRNNQQNDFLVKQKHHEQDLWLHIKGRSGPHVLVLAGALPNGLFACDEKSIQQAASLAAWFALSKNEQHIFINYPDNNEFLVDIVSAKKVYKPKGSLPGLVSFKESRTSKISLREAIFLVQQQN